MYCIVVLLWGCRAFLGTIAVVGKALRLVGGMGSMPKVRLESRLQCSNVGVVRHFQKSTRTLNAQLQRGFSHAVSSGFSRATRNVDTRRPLLLQASLCLMTSSVVNTRFPSRFNTCPSCQVVLVSVSRTCTFCFAAKLGHCNKFVSQ